jgi:hypothetical protein
MKQIVLVTLGFFLICEQSFAQITLNMSGYPTSFIGADSVKATIGNTGIPSIIPGVNAAWDFSGVTYSGSNYLGLAK